MCGAGGMAPIVTCQQWGELGARRRQCARRGTVARHFPGAVCVRRNCDEAAWRTSRLGGCRYRTTMDEPPRRPPRPPRSPRPQPVPQRVYWIRRAVALAILVALVALVSWGVRSAWAALFGEDTSSSATSTGGTGDTSTDAQPADTDTGGPAACDPAHITLTLTSDKTTTTPGETLPFTVTMRYTGEADCTVDAGLSERVVTVHSGNDNIWSSAHCDTAGSRTLLFATGDQDEMIVPWQSTRSTKDCENDLPELKPGTYYAVVSYDGKTSERFVFSVA